MTTEEDCKINYYAAFTGKEGRALRALMSARAVSMKINIELGLPIHQLPTTTITEITDNC